MSALQHLLRGGADNERITAAEETGKPLVHWEYSVISLSSSTKISRIPILNGPSKYHIVYIERNNSSYVIYKVFSMKNYSQRFSFILEEL